MRNSGYLSSVQYNCHLLNTVRRLENMTHAANHEEQKHARFLCQLNIASRRQRSRGDVCTSTEDDHDRNRALRTDEEQSN